MRRYCGPEMAAENETLRVRRDLQINMLACVDLEELVATAMRRPFAPAVVIQPHTQARPEASRRPQAGSMAETTRVRQPVRSLGELPHELAGLLIPDGEIGHLRAAPAGLALGKGEVACGAHDLPHSRMAEQMGVHRRRLTSRTML